MAYAVQSRAIQSPYEGPFYAWHMLFNQLQFSLLMKVLSICMAHAIQSSAVQSPCKGPLYAHSLKLIGRMLQNHTTPTAT
jgi:hypothetical protein